MPLMPIGARFDAISSRRFALILYDSPRQREPPPGRRRADAPRSMPEKTCRARRAPVFETSRQPPSRARAAI